MLLAELLLAVAPAARGDAGDDALIDAGGVHRHRRAEAVTENRDAARIHLGAVGHEFEGVLGVFDLLEADHAPARAFAFAAAAHVEAQHHIAERREEACDGDRGAAVLVAAEAVQHEKRRAPLARPYTFRPMHDTGKAQAVGQELHALFHRPPA